MVKLGNLEVNIDIAQFLHKLKEESFLLTGKNLFKDFKDTGDHVMTNCPFHHNGQERHPSFGVNKETGLYHCFTCEESGNIVKLVKEVLDYETWDGAKQWIIDNYDTSLVINDNLEKVYKDFDKGLIKEENVEQVKGPIHFDYITEEELDKYRYYHPYMYKRGLTDEIIKMFDIGYDNDFKLILSRDAQGNPTKFSNPIPSLTFPVRDINGNCLFIARRSVKEKLFYYPKEVEKPLYGLYEFYKYRKDVKQIIICESMLDALKFWNIPNKVAFALNGVGSDLQIKQINELPQMDIILCLDSDYAGQNAKRNLSKLIRNKYVSEYVLPKGRKDANECSIEELQNLEEKLI